jgi:intein/homing endonuclease
MKSKSDFKEPNYSEDLAEETGIHIGDGSMNMYSHNSYKYSYTGHAIDDLEFSIYFKKLMKKLYNLEPSLERIQKANTLSIGYFRKELLIFKQKMGLPMGPKTDILMPEWILKNKKFSICFIKGLFATDGYLQFQKKHRNYNYYPQLKITSQSEPLINQLDKIFSSLGIQSSVCCDKRITLRHPNKIWSVYIYGNDNFYKFEELIGFINPKHRHKVEIWKNDAGSGS